MPARLLTAYDFAAGLIRDEQIACFYQNTGRLIAAPSRKVYEKLERDLEMMKADGVPVEADMIPPDKLKEEVASDLYQGGQVLHGNGLIHAGLYHQGLLDRARAQGATVIGYCPVTGVERQRRGFVVSTAKGRVAARDVMVATNGYTPKVPSLASPQGRPGSGLQCRDRGHRSGSHEERSCPGDVR